MRIMKVKTLFATFLLASASLSLHAVDKAATDIQIDSTLKSNKIVFIDGRPAPQDTQH